MIYFNSLNPEVTAAAAKEVENYLFSKEHPLLPVPTDIFPRLKKLPEIETVLFDIYGTLIISRSGDIGTAESSQKTEFFRKTLETFELYPLTLAENAQEAYYRIISESHQESKNKGIQFPEVDILTVWHKLFLFLQPLLNTHREPDFNLIAGLAACYEGLQNETSPMPGLAAVLAVLKNRGLNLGIISNAQFFTPLLLARYLQPVPLKNIFLPELTFWSYSEEEAKPSPGLFLKAASVCAQQLRCPPGKILYVGNDMRNDIFPAHGCGMHTALFAGDRRSLRLREKDPLYSYVKPDIIITELNQLAEKEFVVGRADYEKM